MRTERRAEGRRALEVVVCLEDTIVDIIHVRDAGVVVAGQTPGCHIPLPAGVLGEGVTSLVVAGIDPAGRALVAASLEGGAEMRPLAVRERATIELGPTRIHVRQVADSAAAPAGAFSPDRRVLGMVGGSIFAHLAFLGVLFAIPPDAKALTAFGEGQDTRLISVQAKPTEDALREPEKPEQADTKEPDGKTKGAMAAEGVSGKMGDPSNPNKGGRTAIKGNDAQDRPTRGNARDWVANKGVLGVMRQYGGLPVTGEGPEWGTSDMYAYGPSQDGEPGDGQGNWGAGYWDDGGTGGCRPGLYCGPNTIGAGRVRWPGNGPGDSYNGSPTLRMKKRNPSGPDLHLGPTTVEDGGLDKSIVRRVIRSHLDEVRYCYERALITNPELEGNVTIEFVIGQNGAVISVVIVNASVGNEVASCVAQRTKTWDFPRSTGMTRVRYPFDFRSAGKQR